MDAMPNPHHNLVHTNAVKLTLGGGYAVHIFNIVLRNQPVGVLPIAIRAYLVDENRPDSEMFSLELPPGVTTDAIRQIAVHAVRTESGMSRLLGEILDMDK